MKLVFLTGALIALNLTTLTGAYASSVKTLPYGSRMGMQVTVVNEQGIGTSHAVIRTRHTTADAHAYCAEYVLNDSQECVRQAMKDTPVQNKVTADCRTGEFTDLYGDRFRFEGPATGSDTDAQFNIRREADGTLLDGSGASGYGVAFSIFSALCPKAVPAEKTTADNDSGLGDLDLDLAERVTATCYASEVEISDIDMSAADVARTSRIPQAFSIAIDPSNGDWSVNGTSIKPWQLEKLEDGDSVTVIPAASFAMAKANRTFNAMAAMGGADAAQALRSKLIGPVLSSMLKDRYAFFDIERRQLGFFTLTNGKASRLTGARCQ